MEQQGGSSRLSNISSGAIKYVYSNVSVSSNGTITFSGTVKELKAGVSGYGFYNDKTNPRTSTASSYEYYSCSSRTDDGTGYYTYRVTETEYKLNFERVYSQGSHINDLVELDGTYKSGERNSDGYWYVRNKILPKYTLCKYDKDLVLQSTYDVDTKILTTAPIDISNRESNKVKFTLTATGTDYKAYISSDNANWQEVTDITSGVAKELNVDGFNNLYIKIETNTSRINNIDVAYYKN